MTNQLSKPHPCFSPLIRTQREVGKERERERERERKKEKERALKTTFTFGSC